MPKVSTKSAKATAAMQSHPRYNTRAAAAARKKEQEDSNAELQRQLRRTPRGWRPRPSSVTRRGPAARKAKGKGRQQPASPRGATPGPSSSTPKPSSSRRVAFARASQDRSDDGLTDADAEHEIDDMGSVSASTDADGDTAMGNDDRDEIGDDEAPNRGRWGPVTVARRGGMLGNGLHPVVDHQAGPVNPQLPTFYRNMQYNDFNLMGDAIPGGLNLQGPFGYGQHQPLIEQFGQGAFPQPLGAPVGRPFMGMMNHQAMPAGAAFQPAGGAGNQMAMGMGMTPNFGAANRHFFGQPLAGGGNQHLGAMVQQLNVRDGHPHSFGAYNTQFVSNGGNQPYIGAGDQQGMAPLANLPFVNAGNPVVPVGADNGLFMGDANQGFMGAAADASVLNGPAQDMHVQHQNWDGDVTGEYLNADELVARMPSPPEFFDQAPVVPPFQPLADNRSLSPASAAGTTAGDVQPQAGPSSWQTADGFHSQAGSPYEQTAVTPQPQAGPSNWQTGAEAVPSQAGSPYEQTAATPQPQEGPSNWQTADAVPSQAGSPYVQTAATPQPSNWQIAESVHSQASSPYEQTAATPQPQEGPSNWQTTEAVPSQAGSPYEQTAATPHPQADPPIHAQSPSQSSSAATPRGEDQSQADTPASQGQASNGGAADEESVADEDDVESQGSRASTERLYSDREQSTAASEISNDPPEISDAARDFDFGPRIRQEQLGPSGRRYQRANGTWVDVIENADPMRVWGFVEGTGLPFDPARVKRFRWDVELQ